MNTRQILRGQRGASLVIALMFLVVLTILGLVAVRSSTVQERMAGNDRDRAVAFEAAEAALRDAERDIQANVTSANAFDNVCTDGLCLLSTVATPNWNSVSWTGATSRIYGVNSGAGAFPLAVANAPRYIIELLPDLPSAPGNALNANPNSSTTGGTAYRITARGWGRRPGTSVMLQSVYFKQ
ncbi:MAG: PilX N-terminal domain-containing pilus assembly protein [Pseudomonadota bacterium]